MRDTSPSPPRLYSDLCDLWPFVSPPENYLEEVATFRTRFRRHGVADGARVLHLGCGGGSIDYHLKQTYRVTGIDISDAMLAHARRLNPEVSYHTGDIRTHRLAELFDAVLVHDAISYMTTIEELAAVYRTAAAHLAAGGVMVALPEELRSRIQQHRSSVDTASDAQRHVTTIELDYDPDPTDHSFESLYVFVVREGSSVRVEMDRHLCGVFDIDDFLGAIERAGFTATVEPWELTDWKPDVVPLPLITAVKLAHPRG